jgi:hypothetical protein
VRSVSIVNVEVKLAAARLARRLRRRSVVRLKIGVRGNATCVNFATVAIVFALVVFLPALLIGGLFVWAARKDGEEDKALQKWLGIRRRTRLGR